MGLWRGGRGRGKKELEGRDRWQKKWLRLIVGLAEIFVVQRI